MKDGGPAFPAAGSVQFNEGMTMRQWYKGMALAHLANSGENNVSFDTEDVAEYCANVADAMVAEDREAER